MKKITKKCFTTILAAAMLLSAVSFVGTTAMAEESPSGTISYPQTNQDHQQENTLSDSQDNPSVDTDNMHDNNDKSVLDDEITQDDTTDEESYAQEDTPQNTVSVSSNDKPIDNNYELISDTNKSVAPLENGYYTIANGEMCIDIFESAYSDGAKAIAYKRAEQNNQLFYFEKQSNGNYKIYAAHSGKALTVNNDGTIVQSKWAANTNQQWQVIKDNQDFYYIQNVTTGNTLTFGEQLLCTTHTQDSTQQLILTKQSQVFREIAIAKVQDGMYEIRSVLTGHNLDIDSGSFLNGATILQYDPHNHNNQKWYIKNRSDGTVIIESVHSGKYLDMNVGTDKCVQWQYHGGTNQQWIIGEISGNYYIKNVATGNVLDIYQSTMLSGDYVISYPLHMQINQQWQFIETVPGDEKLHHLEDGYYTIANGELCIDIFESAYSDGAKAITYKRAEQNNQLFYFEKQSNGNYKIYAAHSGKALTVNSDGTIVQSKWTDSSNQMWQITTDDKGRYYIKSATNGTTLTFGEQLICTYHTQDATQQLVLTKQSQVFREVAIAKVQDGIYEIRSVLTSHNLDIDSGSFLNGATILQYDSHNHNNQKWYIKNRSDGTVIIESVHSGKYLDMNVGTDKCVQWEYHGGTNQQWIIGEISGNYYIKNVATGNVLDIYQSTMLSGDYVISYPLHMQINQQWQFIETVPGDIPVTSSLGKSFQNGQTTTLSVSAPYSVDGRYEFSVDYGDRHIVLQNYSYNSTCRWTPIDTGTYIVHISILDSTGKKSVLSQPIKVTSNGQSTLTGIDVSVWQGNIDWGAVKNSGTVQYAMLRVGYGRELNQKDTYFEQNYTGATSNDIPVGVYHYSYANTVEDALREAEACLQMLGGKPLALPIAYDIEDTKSLVGVDKQTLTDIAIAFCDRIKEAGYQPMVYCNPDYINNRLDVARLREKGYDMWVAHYGVSDYQMPYPVKMWQYTSSGSVAGINGRVDMNYWYVGADYNGNTPLPAGQKGQCTANNVNIRTYPSITSSQVLYMAQKGYMFTILSQSNDWYHISFGGNREGWIYGSYVQLL